MASQTAQPGGSSGGSVSPFPSGAQTAGGDMYPWYQSYQGQFTAPMSNEQNQALQNQSNFAGSNPLSTAGDYNEQLLRGDFLDSNDPNIERIRQGMQGTKNTQDADARAQIASLMAAGGNALSGARMAADQRYQNQSDNNFNTLMGNLSYNNVGRAEALRNQGVGQAEGLTRGQSGLNESLMNMGSVPQAMQQHDLNSQYNDWTRQIQSMEHGDQQNTANDLALLRINPQGNAARYGDSGATTNAALISALLGGGGAGGQGGGLLNQLLGLLGGSGSGGSKTGGAGGRVSGQQRRLGAWRAARWRYGRSGRPAAGRRPELRQLCRHGRQRARPSTATGRAASSTTTARATRATLPSFRAQAGKCRGRSPTGATTPTGRASTTAASTRTPSTRARITAWTTRTTTTATSSHV